MKLFKDTEDDVHGLVRYSLGITIAVIALTAVAGANMMSQVAQNGSLQNFALFAPKAVPAKGTALAQGKPGRGGDIDYGATGSISSGASSPMQNYLDHPVVLDPCTGKQK